MRFSSLSIRIAAICIGIVLLAMIAVVAANIITAKSRMSTSLFAQLEQLAQSRSASIAEWVAAKKSAVASIKPSVALENPKPFAKTAELAGSFTQAYIGYPDKHAVFSQDRARAAEYDPTQRPWYQQAVTVGGPVVTSPYISSSTGKLLVTFAEPVNADGKLLAGVAASW